jgi:periplasmic divalent cation tolerance protein
MSPSCGRGQRAVRTGAARRPRVGAPVASLGMSSDHVIVASTTDSEESARALAAGAIDAKLGACAQIVGPITSVFRWEGEVQTEQEWRVEIKTAGDRVAALTEHIRANHGYDVPEIIATPIDGGSADYLSWLVEETR